MKTTISGIRALILLAAMLTAGPGMSAERGKITGGAIHEAPGWFKESFLDIADDVDEASDADRHVMLFFQLNGCPYCDRMLHESFGAEPLKGFIQAHFDTIAINIKGDREIAFNEEIEVTEKALSEMLAVWSTPAILFLNADNKTVARVNGYRAPERFKTVLEYVSSKAYNESRLADYLQARLDKSVYQLRGNPRFQEVDDLSSVQGPLMLILEDGSCYDCAEFHDKILSHAGVREEMKPYTVVRLDADSDAPITDVDGAKTTPRELARKHQMIYRPGVLVFNEGKLLRRTDSLIYPHHFKEGLRYVSGGFYKTMDPQTYSAQRTEELLAAGIDIDLGRAR